MISRFINCTQLYLSVNTVLVHLIFVESSLDLPYSGSRPFFLILFSNVAWSDDFAGSLKPRSQFTSRLTWRNDRKHVTTVYSRYYQILRHSVIHIEHLVVLIIGQFLSCLPVFQGACNIYEFWQYFFKLAERVPNFEYFAPSQVTSSLPKRIQEIF